MQRFFVQFLIGYEYKRYSKRFDDLLAVLPYCDEAFFFDNENGFVECAEYKNARLYVKTDNPPAWLNELIKGLRVDK